MNGNINGLQSSFYAKHQAKWWKTTMNETHVEIPHVISYPSFACVCHCCSLFVVVFLVSCGWRWWVVHPIDVNVSFFFFFFIVRFLEQQISVAPVKTIFMQNSERNEHSHIISNNRIESYLQNLFPFFCFCFFLFLFWKYERIAACIVAKVCERVNKYLSRCHIISFCWDRT